MVIRARQGVTNQLNNKLLQKIPVDVAKSHNKSIEELSQEWSQGLEEALFNAFPRRVSNDYLTKSRTIIFNLGKTKLINKIISDDYTFDKIVRLTNEEMMSEENKEIRQKVRQESLAGTVLKPNKEKVIIKRTHKGEEVVETDFQYDDPKSNSVEDARLLEIEKLKEEKAQQKEASAEVHTSDNDLDFRDDNHVDAPMTIANQFSAPSASDDENVHDEEEHLADMKMEDDDEFNKLLAGQPKPKPEPETETETETIDHKQETQELKQEAEEEEDDDDYDPLETVHIDTSVWSGTLSFPNELSIKGEFLVSTAGSENDLKYAKLIMNNYPRSLHIDGRLANNKADEYMRLITKSRHLYLYELLPDASVENQLYNDSQYDKVWAYYNRKSKYGVLGLNPNFIKDGYIAAFSNSQLFDGALPDFFQIYGSSLLNKLKNSKRDQRLFMVLIARQDLSVFDAPNLNSVLDSLSST
ncbi:unnamed protein product [Ambrosiozyma monospora]|uniref:Unnamed protein product n=1 Tax=Ambrosiozyma monospora TaxID=43982 RepID=A0A9W6YTP5_AMBMO|nr:unnamed protein product [Ambrosiozyma monospora]